MLGYLPLFAWFLLGYLRVARYRDALFDSQNKEDWDAVFDTKVRGYENLRKLYPEARMVNFTSVVGGHGNVGQANYAFANEGLEAVARGDNTLSIE